MAREFRPRKRPSGLRDARLIIIASEGANTERIYFEALSIFSNNPRVHVEIIPPLAGETSPERVIESLNRFKREYSIRVGYDFLWLVIDVDRWGEQKLSSVASECYIKKYQLSVSNPCFEMWLLLHLKSLDEYTDETKEEFRRNLKIGNRSRLEIELSNLLGGYSKSNPPTEKLIPHVIEAIERARNLDTHPEHRWPNDLGTRVYLLAKLIIGIE